MVNGRIPVIYIVGDKNSYEDLLARLREEGCEFTFPVWGGRRLFVKVKNRDVRISDIFQDLLEINKETLMVESLLITEYSSKLLKF